MVILTLGSVSSINDKKSELKITYTPSTKTICNNNICTKTIYSGTRFVYEDNTWKEIEKAGSLKETAIECKVIKDMEIDPDVTCIDWNYTSIQLNIKGNKIGDVPIKIYRLIYDETKNVFEKKEQLDKRLTLSFISDTEEKSLTLAIIYGDEIHIGEMSTTVKLQDANTENLDDGLAVEANPGAESGAGNTLNLAMEDSANEADRESMLKFNLDSIPPGKTIIESILYLDLYSNNYDSGSEGINVTVYRVFSNFTVNGGEWTEGDSTDEGTCSGQEYCWNTRPTSSYYGFPSNSKKFSGTTSTGWHNWNVTNGVKDAYDNGESNVSLNLVVHDYFGSPSGDDKLVLLSKEYSTASLRPYLNVTYEDAAGCSNHSDCDACEKCVGGSCTYQSSSEDLKDECGTSNCYTGNCDGSGSCNVYSDDGKHNCGTCEYCHDGSSDGSCDFVSNGQDPNNDCDGYQCDGDAGTPYYWGWSSLTCYYRNDVASGEADCNGAGACKTQSQECSEQGQDGSTGVTCDCIDAQQGCSSTNAGSCNNGLCAGDANESEARTAIENGINNSELTSPTIETDVVVYVIYQNGTHELGTYDKFTSEENQRWAFNYITGTDTYQSLSPIQTILNFWENQSLTISEIESSVSSFINSTKE
jgi:hypothetical protein